MTNDLVIKGGTVIDGLQTPRYKADVGISAGRITRIGRIERTLGRVRNVPKGPRTIDIDILFYGAAIVKTARLEIPHPRLVERRFVLAPLADLAPGLRHPATHRSVREMLQDAPPAVVRLLHS